MLFYRESLALATFALISTIVLRKLQVMSTEMPNWITFIIVFVLNNKIGRFLILNDEEFKIADENMVTEDSSDFPKSGMRLRESSWRYFAAIVEWLSLFCVFFHLRRYLNYSSADRLIKNKTFLFKIIFDNLWH